MKIAAVTRFKHGQIYALLSKLKWSQSELARRVGTNPTSICDIINLRRRPTVEMANRIQTAFADAGEYLDVLESWPETFNGLPAGFKHEQVADVEFERLEDHPELLEIPDPHRNVDGLADALDKAMSRLDKRYCVVMNERFLMDKDSMPSLSDLGSVFGVTRERIRQLELEAMNELRRPSRLQMLEDFLVDDPA